MIHVLKIWPEHFEAVISKNKKFEIRKADRPFRVNDVLLLQEFDPKAFDGKGIYTNWRAYARVTHLLNASEHGLQPGYCIMSIDTFHVELRT